MGGTVPSWCYRRLRWAEQLGRSSVLVIMKNQMRLHVDRRAGHWGQSRRRGCTPGSAAETLRPVPSWGAAPGFGDVK